MPGERLVFFDDLSDTGPGSAPTHWRVRGASVSLHVEGTERRLTATKATALTASLRELPANFTVESELAFGPQRAGELALW